MKVKKVDHIAIAVKNLEDALNRYEKIFGVKGEVILREDMGIKFGVLDFGNFRIELMEPTRDDSPISKFLEKRGEGIHHVAIEVDDIEKAIKEVKNAGGTILDEKPSRGLHGYKMCFIHPKTLNRVLIELIEW